MSEPFSKEELAEIRRRIARAEPWNEEEIRSRRNFSHKGDYDHKDEGPSNTFFISAIALAISLLSLAAILMLRPC